VKQMNESRREFIKTGGCALGMVALATQMQHLGAISTMAQKVIDESLGDPTYKALVCLYWSGGNDGNNMVIPNHSDPVVPNYAGYAAARSAQGLAIPQANLLTVPVPRMRDAQNLPLNFGLHPNLGTVTGGINGGIHPLYAAGKLAVVTNVGNLVVPFTKRQYLAAPASQKPYQLFSHSDQVAQSHTSIANTQAFTGWGGRMSDKMTAGSNPGALIPMITSISGAQLFTSGLTTLPLAIADSNTLLNAVLNPSGFGTAPTGSTLARLNAFNALRGQDLSSEYVKAASHVTDLAMQANTALQSTQETVVPFPNTSIGRQLRQVARLIKERNDLSVKRQIFYVQIGGFDTHTNQPANQDNLFGQMSQAMRSFYDEMVNHGVENSVTLFTLSDFGRTHNPARTGAAVGSDHAWGNHMFVMGGAVAGGDFYGSKRPDGNGTFFPSHVMGSTGPDDSDNGVSGSSNGRGRWIPTTSVDQYAVQLARWFGLQPQDEAAVFPNLINFPGTHSQLGFLP